MVRTILVCDSGRVGGLLEHIDEFAERNVLLHGNDIGSRHHYFVYTAPAQLQDIL
jgi:hypothetical protein